MSLTVDAEKLDNVIYRLYQSENHVELREVFLDGCAYFFPESVSFFDLKSVRNNVVTYFNPIFRGLTEEAMDQFYTLINSDFITVLLNYKTELFVYRDSDILTEEQFCGSYLYKQWAEPMGLHFACGAHLALNGVPFGTVTLLRPKDLANYSDDELVLLKCLSRHASLRFWQLYPNGVTATTTVSNDTFMDHYGLTKRELEIMYALYNNKTVSEIADSMFISVKTVQKHTSNLYRKLGVNSRVQLIKLIEEKGNMK